MFWLFWCDTKIWEKYFILCIQYNYNCVEWFMLSLYPHMLWLIENKGDIHVQLFKKTIILIGASLQKVACAFLLFATISDFRLQNILSWYVQFSPLKLRKHWFVSKVIYLIKKIWKCVKDVVDFVPRYPWNTSIVYNYLIKYFFMQFL